MRSEARNSKPSSKKALLLCNTQCRWHPLLKHKFKDLYEFIDFPAQEYAVSHPYASFPQTIASKIESEDISAIFAEVEFAHAIGVDTLQKLRQKAPIILLLFDDVLQHEVNRLKAQVSDLVLCADPLGVLKHRENGSKAVLVFLENQYEEYTQVSWDQRPVDVLFYGITNKADRTRYLDAVAHAGVRLQIHDSIQNPIAYEDLRKLIYQAKIVLNLSAPAKVGHGATVLPETAKYQFKGRIIEAALAGAWCASEYCPQIELMFPANLVGVFNDPEECAELLVDTLKNGGELRRKAEELQRFTLEHYSEEAQSLDLLKALADIKPSINKFEFRHLPAAYVEILFRYRVLWRKGNWDTLKARICDFIYFLRSDLFTYGQKLYCLYLCLEHLLFKLIRRSH